MVACLSHGSLRQLRYDHPQSDGDDRSGLYVSSVRPYLGQAFQ